MSAIRVSRSAITTRKQCEMKRYLTYHFRKKGIVESDFIEKDKIISMASLPKVRGQIFHSTSLDIIRGHQNWKEQLSQNCAVLPVSVRFHQETLIRRAMIGWELVRGPHWRDNFDVMSSEESWEWELASGIVEPIRMDKVLRRKDDGLLGIFDYKTLSSVDPNWTRRMEVSDQTHLYIQALKEKSGEWCMGMCYDGVVIGSMKSGIQRSPFITGYEKGGKITGKWSAGSSLVDISSYSDEKWLEWMLKQGRLLYDLYTTTEFINPPAAVLLHTKQATGRAEIEFHERVRAIEGIRTDYGEQSAEYSSCLPLLERNGEACYKYGIEFACPFTGVCWDGQTIDDDDVFEERVDHHGESSEDE